MILCISAWNNVSKKMKKGALQLSLEVLVQVILLSMVAFAFTAFYWDVKTNDLFEKSYAARDIALLLETAQAVPGDIEVSYTQPYFDVSLYDYAFNNNLVQIYQQTMRGYSLYYPFFLDKNLYQTFDAYNFEQPSAFIMSKVNDQLTVKEHGSMTLEKNIDLHCSTTPSTKKEKMSIVVLTEDSGFEDVQTYFTDPDNLNVDFYNKETEQEVITPETNLVIVLASGRGNRFTVDVPHDSQSEKVGCFIAQEIVALFPDTDTARVTLNTDTVLTTNTEGLAVRLVVGDHITDNNDLISAIQDGIEEYYDE